MKKVIQKMSLVVFLLSTTLISACTQSLGAVESTQTASIAAQGPLDVKEMEGVCRSTVCRKNERI